MKNITLGQIEKAVSGKLIKGGIDETVNNVSIDSRKTVSGDVFFAIIGENHDAHKFLEQVFSSGCKVAVVSNEEAALKAASDFDLVSLILVPDTVKAMQKLAAWYLNSLDIKKVGVTGSTGKTTTKDMVYYICSEKYITGKTAGNFNNEIGLPLTVFGLPQDAAAAVFEMGMSDIGEIDLLADIVRPNVGIITNIGISHIERLGSREGILRAKLEITNYLGEEDALVINEGGDLLNKDSAKGNYKLITTGTNGKSTYIISDILDNGENGMDFTLEYDKKIQRFHVPIPGLHNVTNASLAIAACSFIGVSMAEAARGLEKLELTDKRLSIKGKNGIKVIDDTYNASPDSMKAAIDVLISTSGVRRVAILGDMFELGIDSGKYHKEIGRYAALKGADLVIAVGNNAEMIAEGSREVIGEEGTLYFKDKEEFMGIIKEIISLGDVVLVKGSRGMKMETIVKKILD